MDTVQYELYMLTIVVLIGLLAIKAAERVKIPDVALFMILGIILGPAVLNLIFAPIDSVSYQFIIVIGSILILFEDGKSIQFAILKRVWMATFTAGLITGNSHLFQIRTSEEVNLSTY